MWFQVHRSAIPCHSVFASNMERIVNRLWLPSNEELEHDALRQKDLERKQEVFAQKIASSLQETTG